MDIMAIEDGLLPLTYATQTHTLAIIYNSAKFRLQSNVGLLNRIRWPLQSHDEGWRWRNTIVGVVDADKKGRRNRPVCFLAFVHTKTSPFFTV